MRRANIFAIILILPLLGAAGLAAQAPEPGSAFLDTRARDLFEGARASRQRLDSAIASYTTTVRQRISVGLHAFWRDRLLFRRELALRLHWRRAGASRVEVLGARSVVPIASTEVEVPGGRELAGSAGDLLFRPGRDRLLVGLEGGDALRHPLADGAEADYRYETGDTIEIRLPDGSTVRLIELRVHPRRNDFDLIAGSFWLDAGSHDVVRAVYRPARPFELIRDFPALDADSTDDADERDAAEAEPEPGRDAEPSGIEEEDDDDDLWLPGFVRPVRFEVTRIAVEYGLWEMRWWLPRLVVAEMKGSAGRWLGVPVRFERTYSAYDVEGVPTGDAGRLAAAPAFDACAREADDDGHRHSFVAPDTAAPPPSLAPLAEGERWGCDCTEEGVCELYVVGALPEPDVLRTSGLLPPSIFEAGEALVTPAELEALGRLVESLPRSEDRWRPPRTELTWGPGGAGLLRYNRVEGLSVGARLDVDFGRATVDLVPRLGSADLEPNLELGVESAFYSPGVRLAAYRRLEAANHGRRAPGFGNSLFAFVFGLDDGDYYRTLGVELGRPDDALAAAIDWRLFAERQSAAVKGTDFSLRHLLDDGHAFRANFAAVDADQVGAAVTLRHGRGLDADGFRWGVWSRLLGSAGTFDFGRASAGSWLTVPLPGAIVGALEVEAGGSVGELPPQSLWRLGGPGSLRGYGGSAVVGEAFWRVRGELASAFPGARAGVFADAAWAGSRTAWRSGRPLVGVGAGASLLDGILRVDLARALDDPGGWRLAIYLGGLL